MQGEQTYNRAVYEVIQEVTRQLLVNDGKSFDYKLQYVTRVASYANDEEQIKILRSLDKKKVVSLREYKRKDDLFGDMDMTYYEVTSTKDHLEKAANSLSKTIDTDKTQSSKNVGRLNCFLRLHDVNLMLKINDYEEKTIARLHEDKEPYKLLTALSNRPSGTTIRHLEIFPSKGNTNLWQIMTKSNLGYLAPFFNWSKGCISMQHHIELTKDEVIALISKINEKYRNNFRQILEELR